jgi:GAF domain-containing protein
VNEITKRARINETQRYAMLGIAFGFTFPLVGTILEILISGHPMAFASMLVIQRTNSLLWIVDTAPIVLGLFAGYAGRKQDILVKVNEQLHERENELKANQVKLQQYANEQTAGLAVANEINERRTAQLEAIAQISRTISSMQILGELLPQITQTISESFGFYHVGIFLLDESKENAILSAANSEGGKKMLERNHRLRVGGIGIVGFVTNTGQPRIALDVGMDTAYFNNPDLPDTHSEIALPLGIGNNVFGALDVQSTETNAFSQEDINILSTLANQVSIAIQNARSYEQTQEALMQAKAASTQASQQQWKQFLTQEPVEGYTFDGIGTKKYDPSGNEKPYGFSVPLILRGTRIGTLKLSASNPERKWTDDEIDMAKATAERATIALENARLIQEAKRQAIKEQTISEVTGKIGASINLKNVLQTAVEELGRALPGSEVFIKFEQNEK